MVCCQVEEPAAGFGKMIGWSEKSVLSKLDEADGYIREMSKWREHWRLFLVVSQVV